MKNPKPRIIIANDCVLLAEACKNLLEAEFDVAAIVTDVYRLRETVREMAPDVVMLELFLGELNGLDVGAQIRNRLPSVKLVYVTQWTAMEPARAAFRIGASAYLIRPNVTELLAALRKTVSGETNITVPAKQSVPCYRNRTFTTREQENPITRRQAQVLQLLSQGMSMKEAASLLAIKPGTIAYHKYQMMQSIGAKSNAELIRYAVTRSFGSSGRRSLH